MFRHLNKYVPFFICLALTLTTLVVYWQVRNCKFIDFDDDLYVTENSTVQNGLTWQGIKWAFTTTHAYNWHPLTWISHMLDCQLYGLSPAGHHFTNLLLHIANTLLLFLLLTRMTGSLWPSAFVAALFALHPLHVESVAWVSERKDVLSTLLWLTTMWLYYHYVRNPRLTTYLPVVFSLALGLMAKQMLVTLPLVLLLLDYWPLQRFTLAPKKQRDRKELCGKTSFYRCFLEKLPLLALSAIASLIIFLIQAQVALVKSTILIPIRHRLANAIVAYAKYIAKMFWPGGLGILYPHPGANLSPALIFSTACLLLCVSAVVILYLRSHRWLIVGWLWYLGTLVPVIGLVQVGHQAMADRYTYVPHIGLFIIIAWSAAELVGKQRYRKVILATAAVTALCLLSVLTWRQLGYWQDSITLFKHTVAVTTNNDILHYNLGRLLLLEGKTDEAIEHWRKAVTIKPDQPTIHKNLAVLFTRQGNIDQAIEHYRQALIYKPNDTEAYKALQSLLLKHKKLYIVQQLYDKANTLAQQGRLDEAIACYTELIQLEPGYAPAYNNLGNALFLQGKPDQALDNYSRALQLEPNMVDAHYNMAVLLAHQGKKDQAIKAYRQTLELDPNNTQAREGLNALLGLQ